MEQIITFKIDGAGTVKEVVKALQEVCKDLLANDHIDFDERGFYEEENEILHIDIVLVED